ncbi:acyl-CoA thioesterase [Kordiimonas sediminis]|nr:thioesterase family protein [Kordiimonas sediminis]
MVETDTRLLSDYPIIRRIPTRWMDNDAYGHVNNVTYYSYFDTAVNGYLIEKDVLDYLHGQTIGLVVETSCKYMKSLEFPDIVLAGVAVSHIGNSSVRYEIGLFKEGDTDPAAQGYFIHVYVDKATRRPVNIDSTLRYVLEEMSI